jgi:hypothetical protein
VEEKGRKRYRKRETGAAYISFREAGIIPGEKADLPFSQPPLKCECRQFVHTSWHASVEYFPPINVMGMRLGWRE